MNELPSSTFRKVYATLQAPVIVTVNGHPIGTYQPIMSAIDSRTTEAIRPGEPKVPARDPYTAVHAVPKPGKGK